jgi:hypothetical protein
MSRKKKKLQDDNYPNVDQDTYLETVLCIKLLSLNVSLLVKEIYEHPNPSVILLNP